MEYIIISKNEFFQVKLKQVFILKKNIENNYVLFIFFYNYLNW
jgi:hypothetical protein